MDPNIPSFPSLIEMMWSFKYFVYVSKMPSLTYNRANSVIIKNVIMLNIIHNIFNLLDTEVVICIILVLLKRWLKLPFKY